MPPQSVIGPELAREVSQLAAEIGRQVGLLVDRSGAVVSVIVGDARGLVIPDLGRQRGGLIRLNGLRLIHTHLGGEPLTQEDLNDLAALRLDLIAALLVPEDLNHPPAIEAAYLLPGDSLEAGVARLAAPHPAALDLDFAQLMQALEAELTRLQKDVQDTGGGDRAFLIGVSTASRAEAEENLVELAELARTAGLTVVDRRLFRPRPGKFHHVLSHERVRQLNIQALQNGVDLLVFDRNLAPAQINRLSDQTELRIIDRTQLILDIFAQRARTREGKIQVEMAQLNYLMPRLTYKDSSLSRLTGGIGARGPGETKLEIDRRRVRDRVARLKKELEQIKAQRGRHRARRAKAGLPVVSIVGYTNAGKSTLLNSLTRSEVLAEDRLFATLDPTSRRLKFPQDRSIIITDTVGFIRDLPPDLVEAFAATLEELSSADLLLHVIDASSPNLEQQVATVEKQLSDLDLAKTPTLRIFNKVDLLDRDLAEALALRYQGLPLSALDPATFPPLIEAVCQRLGWADLFPIMDQNQP